MDKQEAKRVLQALRPNDPDTTGFAEALALVESDPELRAWWEAQQAFDRLVSAKLADVPVPSDLRDRILAAGKIKHYTPRPHLALWLAAAAVVAILCVAGTVMHTASENARRVARAAYDDAALAFLGNDAPPLAMSSPDHDKLLAWLKEQNAPTGAMPAKMAALPSVGCQKFDVEGHKVSLICFVMTGGRLVHLFVIDQGDLQDPPGNSGPEFKRIQGWSTAAWSDGRMSYLLATQADSEALKQLL